MKVNAILFALLPIVLAAPIPTSEGINTNVARQPGSTLGFPTEYKKDLVNVELGGFPTAYKKDVIQLGGFPVKYKKDLITPEEE